MLYYRIDVSEGIGINNTSASKEWDICPYWYFLDKGFKFQRYIWNGCHDDIVILNISSADYRCIINGISESDALNILKILIWHKSSIIKIKKNYHHI